MSDFVHDASLFRIPDMKSSVDASVCVCGINIFGEVAYDWVYRHAAALVGCDFRAGEWLRMASLLKYSPSISFTNEYISAISGEYMIGRWKNNSGHFSTEFLYHPESKSKDGRRCVQVKLKADWGFMPAESIKLNIKLSERLRTWGRESRTDVRLDAAYLSRYVNLSLRLNALKCVGVGLLGYVEGQYKADKLSSYLRMGIFRVDNWDDRIYVYERDAPGSFNVPAYYGRGLWSAWYLSWRYSSWGQICVRASYIDYLFMDNKKRKPSRAELKIQFMFKF